MIRPSLALSALFASLALAACAPLPATAPTTPAPSAPQPTPSELHAPAMSPAASAPAPGGGLAVPLAGRVYDMDGQLLATGSVRVVSLDAAVPYDATVPLTAGSYRVPNAPRGANLAVTATRDGWTARRRVVTLVGEGDAAVDFGSATHTGDAAAFFLADYPEVAATSPLADDRLADPRRLRYSLTVSEPLDQANQARFAAAIRLLPANRLANQRDNVPADLVTEAAGYPDDRDLVVFPYEVRQGTAFRNEPTTRASVLWNTAGTTATLTFDVPLMASDTGEASYQVALAAGDMPVADAGGLQLGLSPAGAWSGYPAPGHLVKAAFRAPDLALAPVRGLAADSREARWAATHTDASRFLVPRDAAAPYPVAVDVVRVGDDSRLVVTFSESLAAYDGTDLGLAGVGFQGAADLARFSFALAEFAGDLEGFALEGVEDGDVRVVDPRVTSRIGESESDWRDELSLAPAAYVARRSGAADGSVLLGLDPADPRRVWLTVVSRPRFFAGNRALLLRSEGVGDPAGNRPSQAEASDHLVLGNI